MRIVWLLVLLVAAPCVLSTSVLTDSLFQQLLSGSQFATGDIAQLLKNFANGQNNNPLTVAHANFFKSNKTGMFGRVYKIGEDAYTKAFTPKNLGYKLSAAVGYGLANTMLITTPQGHIIVDTGSGVDDVADRISAFQSAGILPAGRGPFPFRAIIYTHNHIDHVGGVSAWLANSTRPRCPNEPESSAGRDGTYYPRSWCVEIVGQKGLTEGLVDTCTRSGNIIDARSAYMYGSFLGVTKNTDGTSGNLNCGIGPKETGGGFTYETMSKTFDTWLAMRFPDVKLWLRYAPSETNDESVVFLADGDNTVSLSGRSSIGVHERHYGSLRASVNVSSADGCAKRDDSSKEGITFPTEAPVDPAALGSGCLLSAEVIQGPSFPNLYSLRGTTFRNPLTWYESVDILREFSSWAMVPSHGVPLMGQSNIETLMANYRDAIQYVHDQTLRLSRLGFVPNELVTKVNLPQYILDNLATVVNGLPSDQGMDPIDYLRTFYGSVPQGVREIYSGYLGWNEGDASLFMPLPPVERAQRYLAAMGGADAVIALAQAAYDAGKSTGVKQEFQWCAELLINVLAAGGPSATINKARVLKAQAFLQLAQTTSANVAINQADWWSLNPNWRNWLVTGAMELLLSISDVAFPNAPSSGLIGPNAMRSVPPKDWTQHWCWRYNDSGSQSIQGQRFGFEFAANTTYWSSSPQRFILSVKDSVVRFISTQRLVDQLWPSLTYAVGIPNWDAFSQLVNKDSTTPANAFRNGLAELLASGVLTRIAGGSADQIASFFDNTHFDQINQLSPPIVGRTGPIQ